MKRLPLICYTSLLLLFASCTSDAGRAKDIAYRYSYAMANYDVDAAEPYSTLETRQTTIPTVRNLIGKVGQQYIDSDTPAQIEILSTTIVNDTEAYAIYHKTTPIKNFQDTVRLRKRDGQWQVHAPLPISRKHTQEDIDRMQADLASKSNLKNYKFESPLEPKKDTLPTK